MPTDQVQIFISYAREDLAEVIKLYHWLESKGFKPWMDKVDLLGGEQWRVALEKALRQSDFFLLCLSPKSASKRGFIQREINFALDLWQEKLQDDIYIIPVRIEECEVPDCVADFQWIDWFTDDGAERLLKSFQYGIEKLGKTLPATSQPLPSPNLQPPSFAASKPTNRPSLPQANRAELSSSTPNHPIPIDASGTKIEKHPQSTPKTKRRSKSSPSSITTKPSLQSSPIVELPLGMVATQQAQKIKQLESAKHKSPWSLRRKVGIFVLSLVIGGIAIIYKLESFTSPKQLLQTLRGYEYGVKSVAFSPDGKTLATGSVDKTLKLWDVQTGALKWTQTGDSKWVNSVAFSPDGKTLASGGGGDYIMLRDVQTGTLKQRLTWHRESSLDSVMIAFSPDGKTLVSGSNDKIVRLWDAQAGTLKQAMTGHIWGIRSVAFSPDGKILASGSDDKTVKLWDVRSGTLTHTLTGHSNVVSSVAFSPDGKTLASGGWDWNVGLWNAQTGTMKRALTGFNYRIWTIAFSPDGKMLATGGRTRP